MRIAEALLKVASGVHLHPEDRAAVANAILLEYGSDEEKAVVKAGDPAEAAKLKAAADFAVAVEAEIQRRAAVKVAADAEDARQAQVNAAADQQGG